MVKPQQFRINKENSHKNNSQIGSKHHCYKLDTNMQNIPECTTPREFRQTDITISAHECQVEKNFGSVCFSLPTLYAHEVSSRVDSMQWLLSMPDNLGCHRVFALSLHPYPEIGDRMKIRKELGSYFHLAGQCSSLTWHSFPCMRPFNNNRFLFPFLHHLLLLVRILLCSTPQWSNQLHQKIPKCWLTTGNNAW